MAADDGHDPDREAIMARRRQFIALALGGLATGCAPGKPLPEPNTTGSSAPATDTESKSESEPGSDGESESDSESGSDSETGEPTPCLKFDLAAEPDTGTEGGGTTGGPMPCLVPMGSLP